MSNKAVYIKVLLVLLMSIWYAGIFSNVFLPNNWSKAFPGIFLNKTYSIVCHQKASRSLKINGETLEVCSRCTGIYTGGLIFSILALLISGMRPGSKNLLLLSMLPMAADVLFFSAGFYDYSRWMAFATGLILGSVSILYIFKGIEEYFSELRIEPNVQ